MGYIQLCLSVGRLKDAFTIIIKLGNSALLNQPLRWGQLPSNLQEWKIFLQCMVEVGPPSTSDSDQSDAPITWEGVLLQLIESHGPSQVTRLLDDIDIASVELGAFQCRLNRMLVSLATLQLQQQQLAHNMLGKVDTYLWNPRRNPLGPHAVSVSGVCVFVYVYLCLHTFVRISAYICAAHTKSFNCLCCKTALTYMYVIHYQMLLVTKSCDANEDQVTQQGEGTQNDIITLEDSECHWGIRVAR